MNNSKELYKFIFLFSVAYILIFILPIILSIVLGFAFTLLLGLVFSYIFLNDRVYKGYINFINQLKPTGVVKYVNELKEIERYAMIAGSIVIMHQILKINVFILLALFVVSAVAYAIGENSIKQLMPYLQNTLKHKTNTRYWSRYIITPPLKSELTTSTILDIIYSNIKGNVSGKVYELFKLFSFSKALFNSFFSKSKTFRLGYTRINRATQIFIDIPVEIERQTLKRLEVTMPGFTFLKIDELKIYTESCNIYFAGNLGETIKLGNEEVNPIGSWLDSAERQDVEVCINITPLHRVYNVFLTILYQLESKTQKVQGYEKSKQMRYAALASQDQFDLNIKVLANNSNDIDQFLNSISYFDNSNGRCAEIIPSQSVLSSKEIEGIFNINAELNSLKRNYIPRFKFPVDWANNKEFLVNIGNSTIQGHEDVKVGIRSWDDLSNHLTITGASRTGKTEILKNVISQVSTKVNCPMFIFDFKGMFGEEVLQAIDAERIKDIVYLCPSEMTIPMSVANSENFVVDSIEMLKMLAQTNIEGSWGDQVEQTMRGVLKLQLKSTKKSLRAAKKILLHFFNKTDFSELSHADDDDVRMLAQTIKAYTNNKIPDLISTPINKVSKLLSTPRLELSTDNYNAKLDFYDCVKENKIVVVNFRGLSGIERDYFAIFYMLKFFQAMSKKQRFNDLSKVVCVVDEAQVVVNLLPKHFETAFSQYRQLNIAMILANQFTNQLNETTSASLLNNAGTRIVLRVKEREEVDIQLRNLDLPESFIVNLSNMDTSYGLMKTIDGLKSVPTLSFKFDKMKCEEDSTLTTFVKNETIQNYYVDDPDNEIPLSELKTQILGEFTKSNNEVDYYGDDEI